MLELAKKDLELVQAILKHYIPHLEVYAYGSRVSGKSHPGSDLDLVVVGDDKHIDINQLREAFRESNLPITVDIFYWDDLPEAFKGEISQQKVKIFPK